MGFCLCAKHKHFVKATNLHITRLRRLPRCFMNLRNLLLCFLLKLEYGRVSGTYVKTSKTGWDQETIKYLRILYSQKLSLVFNQCSGSTGSTCFWTSRIRIHQSEVWIRILLSLCKNSKKNLNSFYFVTLFDFLSLKNDVNGPSKSNKQKKLC